MASCCRVCLGLYPLLLLFSSCSSSCAPGRSWAVRLQPDSLSSAGSPDLLAQAVAQDAGLQSHGQIGQLEGHYLLCQDPAQGEDWRWTEAALDRHPHVAWHSQEHVLRRSKRSLRFNDPKYPSQWHLVSEGGPDAHIQPAYSRLGLLDYGKYHMPII